MTYTTYVNTGPFVNGSSPGISASFLNALETFCHSGWFDSQITSDTNGNLTAKSFNAGNGIIRGAFFLATPFLLANNVTINSGVTNNYTCVGGSTGVPSSAKAVLLEAFYTPSAAGTSCKVTPHSTAWGAGQYPLIGTAGSTQIVCGNCWTTMDGSGIIDVLAGGGNLVGLFLGIRAYLI